MVHKKQALPPLLLGALGVVYGDIGTSPLYTLRECLNIAGVALNQTSIYGILSLITWALLLVVTLKYVMIVMRVDNRGEGGILALSTRASALLQTEHSRNVAITIGLLGTALFYADSLITPAISVLGAMEGMSVISPQLSGLILPCAVALIAGLFAIQRKGSAHISAYFGPIMLVWFSVIGMFGFAKIIEHPEILHAFHPLYAYQFATISPTLTLLVMGAVVLAVTGAEALYADMGHFGRKPIQYCWLYFVGPALLLNYYGQGALLLADPTAIANPFYLLAPEVLRIPLIILAAAATVIASQAVISGAYSLTAQAIQLGYLPRMRVLHTSADQAGQIYLPNLNTMMAVAVILLVLAFQSSSNLAHAYGLAVTGAMMAVTLLMFVVFGHLKNPWRIFMMVTLGVFLVIESSFFASTMLKILSGGWFPLMLGGALFFLMHTWLQGRKRTSALMLHHTPTLDYFLQHLDTTLPVVPRTAIFMASSTTHVPPALLYNVHHNGVWHAQTIILKIGKARLPRYPHAERVRVTHLAHGVSTIHATFGFMEQPDIPALLRELQHHGLVIKYPESLSYMLSIHTYIPSPHGMMNRAQEFVFILMDKLQQSAVNYFHLPRGKVIEIGHQMEI